MSYNLKVSTPTQCVSQTIAWSGPPVQKALGMWVQDTNYFAEIIRNNLTDSLGTVDWMCDVPAGAWIAFEIYALPNGTDYDATRFYQVQPGETDACLRTNEGQRAAQSMAALASSLSSASPQLFTYPATSTSTTSTPTTTLPPPTTTGPEPSPSSSSSPLNVGALAGGIAGGVCGVLLLALLIFLFLRRRLRDRSSPSSKGDTEKTPSPAPPPPAGGGFFRAVSTNPVDAWRTRVQSGAPPSRRSRAFSGATTAAGLATPLSAQAPAVPQLSTGPRAGVPEVGESRDFEAYRAPAPAVGTYGALPAASASATGLLHAYDHAPTFESLGGSAPPIRPPTRLTTPGGLTEFGGAGEAQEAEGGGAGYASYSRV
ncbi:hypothetical protein JCM10450v2_001313 [Rhodotorula kratochvilovae]